MTYSYTFDLVSGEGSGLAGLSGQVTAPAVIGIIGGGACLVASLMPAPKGRGPQNPRSTGNSYNYQPSNVRTTSGDSGAPSDLTYMGGAGLQYPQDYVNGIPIKPRYWQSQQHGPICPIHGTMCNANFLSTEDPGAWFCPKCHEQGRNSGFPWGRQ
jgi:hypothetical protein